ncbi:MAG: alpha-L-glycero-D-manno-heptose beta-1,4-glucosyltransferase [Zetaproteobacteria bacterium CG_4_9_14_3_um_filter_49_83]|nr:MAG: alpha-L-glycero-D-manno-heptose beta-1,4-glucosyltransferase [Zetaproteobacteria bacterium CG1_02_49_23]PIQ31631.1 MAG: alpha-L-glycero-D-manno-heptose beta-1,4-glucosyltransferase [Zetaproteobacteria bacterium CG17_big_fil_post_rev_8_21_14_2_50_50_13]PIY55497.1 MAG: alpha-L-glycero-D-manno-heptose beta-1,4-glucosyltransferase [Zetaproteobacteria bacterium CG_4_10_14_0_8_um_filter_49_80]PJA34853.1 MAG: alpha-L-glycero-D-manno-heptose beta-1,4-glucosyltransferase [Zetaproteobacteria bacte
MKISAYIMTYNEADKIADAINSVLWADEIIVADSSSTDGTIEIAESLGAKVVQIPFKTFGQIRNDAIAACTHDWIFSLDADERCTAESHAEMMKTLENPQADVYYVPRRNWFLGRWVNHSGWYPDYRQPQLFKKGALTFDAMEEVHEAHVIHGKVEFLKEDIIQIPFKDIAQMVHKMQRYSTLGAKKVVRQQKGGGIIKGLLHGFWGFFRLYVLKLGILDGRAGFIIALGNFEGTFYRYAKAAEIDHSWNTQPPKR